MAGNKLSAAIDLDISALEKNAAIAAEIISGLKSKMNAAFSGGGESAGESFGKSAAAGFEKAEKAADDAKKSFEQAGDAAESAAENINKPGNSSGFEKAEADANRFTKTLGELQAQLKRFEAGLKNATNQQSFDRINRAIDATKQKINALNTGGTEKFVRGQREAGQAVIDFSRIVQDAPYTVLSGNISAIANNFDPLILSFQRAGRAGGGFTGALKAIGSSLAGGAGLGLAVSLVTSSLVLFGDKLFGASAATKAANQAIKELAETMAKDLTQLTTLVGLVRNVNASQRDRENALKALNQEYDTYIKNLGLEAFNLKNIQQNYDAVTESLLRQAVVKGLQAEITAEVEKTANALIKLKKQQQEARIEVKKTVTEEQKDSIQKQQLTADLQAYRRGAQDGAIATAKLSTQTADFAVVEKSLRDQLKQTLSPLLTITDNFADLGIKLDDTKKKGKDVFKDTIDEAKALADFLDKTTIRQFKFEIDPRDSEQKTFERAKEFIKRALDPLQRETFPIKLGFNAEYRLDIKAINQDAVKFFEKLPAQTIDLKEKVEKEIEALTKRNPILIAFDAQIKAAKIRTEQIAQIGKQLQQDLQSSLAGAVQGLGDVLGNVLSGQDIGSAIFETLGSLIQQIGQALIKFAIARALLDKALKNPLISPAAAFALGFAAVALGQVVKNIRPAGARAQGGPVSPGQPIIVGEKGKEVFVPSTAGRIESNSAISNGLNASGGALSVSVGGRFVLEGTTLVAAVAAVNRSQNRLS